MAIDDWEVPTFAKSIGQDMRQEVTALSSHAQRVAHTEVSDDNELPRSPIGLKRHEPRWWNLEPKLNPQRLRADAVAVFGPYRCRPEAPPPRLPLRVTCDCR